MIWRRKPKPPSEGQIALQQAENHLRVTKARWEEVNRVSDSFHESRRNNHFAQGLEAIFGGKRQ